MAIKENTNQARLQLLVNVSQVYGRDKYGNPRVRERTLLITATRERIFRVRAYGLKPSTKHYLFFNGERIADQYCKPINFRYTQVPAADGRKVYYGLPLISYKNGYIDFYFLYRVNTPLNSNTLSDYYYLLNAVSGRKYLVVTDYEGDLDGALSVTNRASKPEYHSTMIDFLNSEAASYAIDYIDIKAKFNLRNWINKNKFTVEG